MNQVRMMSSFWIRKLSTSDSTIFYALKANVVKDIVDKRKVVVVYKPLFN